MLSSLLSTLDNTEIHNIRKEVSEKYSHDMSKTMLVILFEHSSSLVDALYNLLHLSFVFLLLTCQSFISWLNKLLQTQTTNYKDHVILAYLQNNYHGNCLIFENACE